MEKTYISVIVPVYNREHLLVRCLDTLIYQTLENIEILVIDDYSTDNSLKVALKYQERFPEKVKVLRNTKKGVSFAKNMGIEHATGEFITFVDSDDYVEYWAYEKMYERAKKSGCEILCSPMYKISENRKAVWGRMKKKELVHILFSEVFSLCTKLIRKDVFERFGRLPELRIGEDACFLYSVLSYLDGRIDYFEQPYYYYELSENSVSQSNTEFEVVEDILKGNSILLERCNPEYLNVLKCIVIRRTRNMMFRYEEYKDMFVQYLKEHKDLYEYNLFLKEKCPVLYQQLEKLLEESEVEIPHIAYIRGFGKLPDQAYMKNLKEGLFRTATELIVLNEENCDITENELVYQAYKQGKFQFVGDYFVLKQIFQQGGFFVSERMQLNCSLDTLTYHSIFFSYMDDSHFSKDIYGATKGNRLIEAILETYQMSELYENPYEDMAHRIKTVLIAKAGVRLYACDRKDLPYGLTLYEPSKLLQKTEGKFNFSQLRLAEDEEGVALVREDTLRCTVRNQCMEAGRVTKNNDTSDNMVQILLHEKEELLNSTSWRVTKPLRKVGDMVKRVVKPQYRK